MHRLAGDSVPKTVQMRTLLLVQGHQLAVMATLRSHSRLPPRSTIFGAVEQLFPYPSLPAETAYECWPQLNSLPLDYDTDTSVDRLSREPYWALPLSPFDLFAVAAHLLDISGAYHHVQPAPDPRIGGAILPNVKRVLSVSEADIEECRQLAKTWRRPVDLLDEKALGQRSRQLRKAHILWDRLLGEFGDAPVFEPLPEHEPPPPWWHIALKLLIIADEAAEQSGFELGAFADDPNENNGGRDAKDRSTEPGRLWFMTAFELELYATVEDWWKRQRSAGSNDAPAPADPAWLDRIGSLPDTLSGANPDVVCIAPKSRTTAVGCTMRSLSHHLALLPPRGVARASWTPLLRGDHRRSLPEDEQFNLLLVPFPFTIEDREFKGLPCRRRPFESWGSFRLDSGWRYGHGGPFRRAHIVDSLARFVGALAANARQQGAERIDAVVFPELAFDHRIFRGLVEALPRHLPELRLMIAGLSSKRPDPDREVDVREGNFVGVASIQGTNMSFQSIREKHHRWRLDESQILAYGLEGVLDQRMEWWESIDLLSRRVDFTVFQRGSVLAAMICEDLARVDPCQEVLRAIGPNLVLALLMDAPQLKSRWPARYATILAEDPGSSVLTLTSRALMTRQRRLARWPESNYAKPIVALWRDNHSGTLEEIECPDDCHGVWLKLLGMPVADISLDGRRDDHAIGWIRGKHVPLRISDVDTLYPHIVGVDDTWLRRRSGA